MSDVVRLPASGMEARGAAPRLSSEQMRRLVEDIAGVIMQAAGAIRTMRSDGERSRALAEQYRDLCERQHLAFEDELLAIGERYIAAQDSLEIKDAALVELRAIAEIAVRRYLEAEAWGQSALERAEAAELRAGRAEQGLAALLSVMEGRLPVSGRAGAP